MGDGKDSAHQQSDSRANKGQGEERKDGASAMPKPSEPSNQDEQTKRHQHAQGSQCGEIGHDSGRACRHTDRDGEDEIDHQGPNGQEGPGLAKGSPARGRRAASVRETRDELVVVHGHNGDHHDDQRHRRQEQGKIAAQPTQCSFNSVGHRRNGVGHHGEGEGEQE